MIITKKSLPRRTFLRGIGASLALPLLDSMVPAMELGKGRQLGSLEVGLESPSVAGGCDCGYSCAYPNTVSWRSPTTPLAVEVNPRMVFERLFGHGDSTDPAARLAVLEEQRS